MSEKDKPPESFKIPVCIAEMYAGSKRPEFNNEGLIEYILKSTADKQVNESYNEGLTEGREYNC